MSPEPASPSRARRIGGCVAGVTTSGPALARLWLALASLNCDVDGRTTYGPGRLADELKTSYEPCASAIDWLIARSLVIHDTTPDGTECWRLVHYDWQAPEGHPLVGGYGVDRLSDRDGLPPAYGRPVDAVITPNPGGEYTPPPWEHVAADIHQNRSNEETE